MVAVPHSVVKIPRNLVVSFLDQADLEGTLATPMEPFRTGHNEKVPAQTALSVHGICPCSRALRLNHSSAAFRSVTSALALSELLVMTHGSLQADVLQKCLASRLPHLQVCDGCYTSVYSVSLLPHSLWFCKTSLYFSPNLNLVTQQTLTSTPPNAVRATPNVEVLHQ